MTDDRSLEAAKRALRRSSGSAAPTAEAFVPEIRSNIKWKRAVGSGDDFRPEAQTMLQWSFGVPFAQIEAFHQWLDTHEVKLAILCSGATAGGVAYLGTYLHMDTGSPRYQTLWGLKTEDAETVLKDALGAAKNARLLKLMAVLRGYWSRDAGASDHRFGLARHFKDFERLPMDSAFWQVTLDSCAEMPQPPRTTP